MYRRVIGIAVFIMLGAVSIVQAADAPASEEEQYMAWAAGIWQSLNRRQGDVKLADGAATLKVSKEFYYLDPTDTEKVLVDIWGNPPGSGTETQGMLFPEGTTPFDDGSWGVLVNYEEDGHVSDEDADKINYDELLAQMQEDTRQASEERVSAGYEPVELIGWAAKPFYDKESHKLHWAKEIKFGNNELNMMNYSIRVLGRKGVLVLNFITDMNQKAVVDKHINTVLAMADFDQGSRYADFDPSVDKLAAYGIGALIAGKVLAKTGLIAAAIIFAKKFGVLFLIAIGALWNRFFRRKKQVV